MIALRQTSLGHQTGRPHPPAGGGRDLFLTVHIHTAAIFTCKFRSQWFTSFQDTKL